MTFRGMRGQPGLRTYSSPVTGMQSGSSRSASAASREMSVPSHSSSIVLATPRDVSDGVPVAVRLAPERAPVVLAVEVQHVHVACDYGAERMAVEEMRLCAITARNGVGGGSMRKTE